MPAIRHRIIKIRASLGIALLLFPAIGAHAAPLVVAQLKYQEGTKTIATPVRLQKGMVKSAVAGKPRASWILDAGDLPGGGAEPAARVIRFYQLVDKQPALLCTVLVKYYPHNGKWRPAYRMEERVMLLRDGKGLKTIPMGTGDIELSLLISSNLPNPEGYYNQLRFGFPSRSTVIDAWEVN